MTNYQIGIIGLGVMGHNLALNIERNDFPLVGFDQDELKIKDFSEGDAAGKNILCVSSAEKLVAALERPRCILLIVPASAVDNAIGSIKPYLEPGDILLDGGNSFFLDSERRSMELANENINFMGCGISGGEEGALWGPAIMPGGQHSAWEKTAPVLRAIAAKAEDGENCVDYIGPRGAGHYVKMVHNGIEYADMQLIAEIYDILHRGLGISSAELSGLFSEWNDGELKSYLIEITAKILARTDSESGKPLVDLILDEAKQKGTGKWASQNSMDIGAAIPTINASVESRILSGMKEQRIAAGSCLSGPRTVFNGNRQQLIEAARDALYASKIICYAQGLALLREASNEYRYNLNLADIAKIWRAGCIIRAGLLEDIMAAYRRHPEQVNLLLDEPLRGAVTNRQQALRKIAIQAIDMGIPAPAICSSLGYYDSYRSERLPANLIQAQRDYFGAHTYRRVDQPGVFHTDWMN